jgi:hypothetical protein
MAAAAEAIRAPVHNRAVRVRALFDNAHAHPTREQPAAKGRRLVRFPRVFAGISAW